jgi:hypothetical protein
MQRLLELACKATRPDGRHSGHSIRGAVPTRGLDQGRVILRRRLDPGLTNRTHPSWGHPCCVNLARTRADAFLYRTHHLLSTPPRPDPVILLFQYCP